MCDHIQTKATEQYFPMVLCIISFRQRGSHFGICGWNPSVTFQIKAIEHYFLMVLFIMLYKVVLLFECVAQI